MLTCPYSGLYGSVTLSFWRSWTKPRCVMLVFGRWNLPAGGEERVTCTAIAKTDWQTKRLQPHLRSRSVRQLRFTLHCPETNKWSIPSFNCAENKISLIGLEKNLILAQVKGRLLSWTVVCGYNIKTPWTKLCLVAFKMNIHTGNTVFSVQYVGCVVERERRNVEAE
jgi:hypothetical protein